MKYVLNKVYGGFVLSPEAEVELNGVYSYDQDLSRISTDTLYLRSNPKLIDVVEKLGRKSYHNFYSKFEIVEIPEDYTDIIYKEYDGMEYIIYCKGGKIFIV